MPYLVYLNVYNVTSFNKVLECMGFGLYHTSISIFDNEFSYGGHEHERSGIVVVEQGNSAGLILKERLPIGFTYYSCDDMDEIIDFFGDFWHGCDYDPFSKNCNNFTEELAKYLCQNNLIYYPSYINRFCKLGSILRMWFKPLQDLVGDIVNYDGADETGKTDHSYDVEMQVPYWQQQVHHYVSQV